MVSFEQIQAAYYMVAATGVLVAAVFYVLNMKTTLQTRQAQLLMQVYGQFNNKEFNKEHTELTSWDFKDYDDFQRKYAGTPEQVEMTRSKMNYVFSFYEGVGVLVYRRLLDPRYVDDLMSSYIFLVWHKFGPVIIESRKRRNTPELWDKTEYLYNEISKIYEMEHGMKPSGAI